MASENEKRETVADIVAAMRKQKCATVVCDKIPWYADRLEAAWKQEKAEVEANALACGGIVEASRHTLGNAAAMREALVAVKKSIDGIGESSLDCDPTILMAALIQVCARLSARIERALSTPARNCGRYKDAPSAYADFIVPWKLDGHLDDVPTLQDFADWLFAPAAERKGDGDGR